jgi:hypothetical protein
MWAFTKTFVVLGPNREVETKGGSADKNDLIASRKFIFTMLVSAFEMSSERSLH